MKLKESTSARLRLCCNLSIGVGQRQDSSNDQRTGSPATVCRPRQRRIRIQVALHHANDKRSGFDYFHLCQLLLRTASCLDSFMKSQLTRVIDRCCTILAFNLVPSAVERTWQARLLCAAPDAAIAWDHHAPHGYAKPKKAPFPNG